MKSFDVVAETRRRWSADERRQIVAESEAAAVSVVARRHGVAVSLVFRWRRQAGLSGKRAVVKKADLIKLIWHDGHGMCLFAKRLERGRFT